MVAPGESDTGGRDQAGEIGAMKQMSAAETISLHLGGMTLQPIYMPFGVRENRMPNELGSGE